MSTDYFRLDHAVAAPPSANAVSRRTQFALFLAAALIIITRRPDAIFNAQFFGPDGAIWYADALRLGTHSLLLPQSGYLQLLPRLAAAFVVALSTLSTAPFLMNVIGLAIQVLPVNLLASSRCVTLGSLPFRLLLGFTYLALPNSSDVDLFLTNACWHLALSACLLLLAAPAQRSWLSRGIDFAVLLLSGLTGPFCFFLLPIAAIAWWHRRHHRAFFSTALLAVCSVLQFNVHLHADAAARSIAPLGASPALLNEFLAGHVFLPAIFGSADYAARLNVLLLVVVSLAGCLVLVFTALRAKWEIKLLLLFSLLLFVASLISPHVSQSNAQWPILAHLYGTPHWFFPMLAFVWALLYCALPAGPVALRRAALAALLCMFIGAARDWEYPAFPDRNFAASAASFALLPEGQSMLFPLYPDGWNMQLAKGVPTCNAFLTGFIDDPANNAVVSRSLLLRGWLNASLPVRELRFYIDGTRVASLAPNTPRPDVDKLFPNSVVKEKGWTTNADIQQIMPGRHMFEVRVLLQNACEAKIGARPIEVAP